MRTGYDVWKPCLVCDRHLRIGRGRWSEGRLLYARINGKTVAVGIACDHHFQGERRLVHFKKGGDGEEFVAPGDVELVRSTESRSPPRGTGDRVR